MRFQTILALLALSATAVFAAPVGLESREATPEANPEAEADPQNYNNYGQYGNYGTYGATTGATTPAYASYGSYPPPPGGYASYGTYKREAEPEAAE
jgi:hypothetical protein